MFGDEASFWLDGTLYRTWSRVGVQPRVDTFGMRNRLLIFSKNLWSLMKSPLQHAKVLDQCNPG
jgi:hypothetical protein